VLREDHAVSVAAAGSGMLRVQRVLTELLDSLHVAHFLEIGVIREACNRYYDELPAVVEKYMGKINEKLGTS